MLKLLGSPVNGNSQAESDDSLPFLKSLQELKELRSQIHYAADYCEKSFLKSEDKAAVMDNTKEYLCRAVVTIIDHLGSVSTNLNGHIQKFEKVSETELRINSLKQKLDSCNQYNHNFTLTKFRRSKDLPRHYPRYISPPSDSSKEESNLQLMRYTSCNKTNFDSSPTSPLDINLKGNTVTPVLDGLLVAPKLTRNPSFHFQGSRRVSGIRKLLKWKSKDDHDVVPILRRSKREPSRFFLKMRS